MIIPKNEGTEARLPDSRNGYLIDSDIIIEILKGNNKVKSYVDLISSEDKSIYYSPVSKAEIFAGAFDSEKDNIRIFFNQIFCLNITADIGEKAGYIINSFRRSHRIGLGDALIAATAIFYDLELITQNIKHYPMSDINIAKLS